MSDLDLLKKVGVFSGLSDEALAGISQKAVFLKMEKGSYIFYRGDESDGVYFVAAGSVQIIIDSEDNKEIIVYSVGEGDVLGELSIFENHRRSATAVALTDARLFKIPNSGFVEIMTRHPAVAVNLSRTLVNRLLAANVMIERLGAMDGTERVADFVRALAAREGKLKDDQYVLQPRPTYTQISHRLGISEKTVYRTMRQMAGDGKIALRGRGLIVPKKFVDSGK